jgi:hypothetical protein
LFVVCLDDAAQVAMASVRSLETAKKEKTLLLYAVISLRDF